VSSTIARLTVSLKQKIKILLHATSLIGNSLEPQALIALIVLGMIGAMLLISKLFAKLWVYLLLSSPSWGITLYNVFTASVNGEPLHSILLNHATGLIFILAPIDQYVVADPTLHMYGLALEAIWLYIIIAASAHHLNGLLLPASPLIFWVLGKGLPNTFKAVENLLPHWLKWLTAYSGLPLIMLACAALGLFMFLLKRRR